MNLVWGLLVTVVVTAMAVALMLFVRRRSPEGSRFSDGDRAAGVFGFFATGFALLLGISIYLGFTSYDQSRAGAETEATLVVQQLETAQFLPSRATDTLSGQLVCYARAVAGPEWRAMDTGSAGERFNPWGVKM